MSREEVILLFFVGIVQAGPPVLDCLLIQGCQNNIVTPSRTENQAEKIKPRIQCQRENSLEQGISGHSFDSHQKMKLGPQIKLRYRIVIDLNSIGSINRTGLFIIQGSNVCT